MCYHENTFALKLPISWLHHHAFSLTGFNILKNAVGSAKFLKIFQLANTNTRLLDNANFQLNQSKVKKQTFSKISVTLTKVDNLYTSFDLSSTTTSPERACK